MKALFYYAYRILWLFRKWLKSLFLILVISGPSFSQNDLAIATEEDHGRKVHWVTASLEANFETDEVRFLIFRTAMRARAGIYADNATLQDGVFHAFVKAGFRLFKWNDQVSLWAYYPWLNWNLQEMKYNTPYSAELRLVNSRFLKAGVECDFYKKSARPGIYIAFTPFEKIYE
jgi:hypothetical protein